MLHWDTIDEDWFPTLEGEEKSLDVFNKLTNFVATKKKAVKVNEERLLVLVVDEARSLLSMESAEDMDYLWLFARGLKNAFKRTKTKYGDNPGIFGIIIDTSPEITRVGAPFEDPRCYGPSARALTSGDVRFPPFVLTHTMDIHHRNAHRQSGKTLLQFHQGLVLNEHDSWENVVRMGRPLWKSLKEDRNETLAFAASKLVCGHDIYDVGDAFSEIRSLVLRRCCVAWGSERVLFSVCIPCCGRLYAHCAAHESQTRYMRQYLLIRSDIGP